MPSIDLYNAFDRAAALEAKLPSPPDYASSAKRLSALIDKLPQRAVIEDQHAERWVRRTMNMAMGRMEIEHGEGNVRVADVHAHCLWHIRRASAIGGSEIGTVVRHFRNERGGFSNAHNLVLEKLLIMAPMAGTEEMNRGVRAEPIIQDMYLKETGAVSDEAALDVLKGYRWEEAPFIVGTPDDLVTYPNGVRKIIDYKCPSAAVNEEYEKKGAVSFDYVCQVHQYGVLSKARGLDFSGMTVCCFDPRYFVVTEYEIDYDPELEAEMIDVADTLWNEFVMKGLVPDPLSPPKLDSEDPELKDLVMQAAYYKKIIEDTEARQKDLISMISAIGTEEHEKAEGKIDLGFATFDRYRRWDEKSLTDLAEAGGIDIDEFRKPQKDNDPDEMAKMLGEIFSAHKESPAALQQIVTDMSDIGIPKKMKLDLDALAAGLEAAGISTAPAMSLSEKFSISRAKTNAPTVKIIADEAERLGDFIETTVIEDAKNILETGSVQPEDDQDYDYDM